MSFALATLAALYAMDPQVCPDSSRYECTNQQVEASIRTTPEEVSARDADCLYSTDADCLVVASGTLSGDENGPRIGWQKLVLSGAMPTTQMVILYDVTDQGAAFIGQGQSSGNFLSPELHSGAEGKSLIHVPGRLAGTGSGNADMLFVSNEAGKWRRIDIESWKDTVGEKLPSGFGIWKGVGYNFAGMFAFSSVWRDSDANCCATGGTALLDFAIEGDTLVLTRANFNETLPADEVAMSPLAGIARLQCPVEQAVYTDPEQPEWQVTFAKPRIAPGNASDLLMSVSGIDFVRDFAFTQAQGFGGIHLLVTEMDEDAGQPMTAQDQPDGLSFYAFNAGPAGGLAPLEIAPQAGDAAPGAIFIPDVSRHFWYDAKRVDTETGEALPDPVDLAQGLFLGQCSQN